MSFFRRKFEGSPEYARIPPFIIFVRCTTLKGELGEDSLFWAYLRATLVGAWLISQMRGSDRGQAVAAWTAIFSTSVCLGGLFRRPGTRIPLKSSDFSR